MPVVIVSGVIIFGVKLCGVRMTGYLFKEQKVQTKKKLHTLHAFD